MIENFNKLRICVDAERRDYLAQCLGKFLPRLHHIHAGLVEVSAAEFLVVLDFLDPHLLGHILEVSHRLLFQVLDDLHIALNQLLRNFRSDLVLAGE